VDASTLVGEMLRDRGLVLLASPHLDLYVPERMWDETRHEVDHRLRLRVGKGLLEAVADRYWTSSLRTKTSSAVGSQRGRWTP
jgi:hypothetical protein